MGIKKIGQWDVARRILRASQRDLDVAIKKTLLQEALFYKKQIVQGIRKQAPGGKDFQKLAPNTLTVRKNLGVKGSKALIKHGDLIRSIQVIRKRAGVFIGVPRTVSSSDGRPMTDLAKIHEEGAGPIVIRMTPKMRKFLAINLSKKVRTRGAGGRFKTSKSKFGGGSGSGVVVIQIPARPFLAPVLARWGKPTSAVPRVTKRMAKNLKLKYGKGFG